MSRRSLGTCAALVLAALLVTVPAGAADRVARAGSVVVREGPTSSQPAIAMLQRGNRVRFLGERDGWTEVGLSDGRRGWVESADVSPVVEAAATPNLVAEAGASEPPPAAGLPRAAEGSPPPAAGSQRTAEGSPPPATGSQRTDVESWLAQHGQAIARLETEIGALRRSIDRITGAVAVPPATGAIVDPVWTRPDALIACAAAFVLGIVVGGASQRRRARHERSLRF